MAQPVSARHDFDARSPDELTLRKAERLQLLELDDGFGDGWYLGRHLSRDATGLFPGVYTAKLPPHIAAAPPPSVIRSVVNTPPQSTSSLSPALSAASTRPPDSEGAVAATPPSLSPPSAGPDAHRSSAIASVYGWARNAISPPAAAPQGHSPAVQRSISQALQGRRSGEESPVMNETLSVIDEHITDLRSPRQLVVPQRSIAEDSESDYSSSHVDHGSILLGPESEADEQAALTKEEVAAWDHHQVANHLRSIGVDAKHCDIFEDQEISGEVLLDMDQSFIHMKDFDFGVMGRRLKTWHKIRDFQTQTRTRPSAGAVREISHSHRQSLSQSSIDFGAPIDLRLSSATSLPGKHQTLVDQDGAAATSPVIPAPLTGYLLGHESADMSPALSSHADLDRGYFSGNEVDKRKARNTLRKHDSTGATDSPVHSRQSSLLDGRLSTGGTKQSRMSFVNSPLDRHTQMSAGATSPAKASSRPVYKGRFRSASARSPVPPASLTNHSPAVTNLENEVGTGPTGASAVSALSRKAVSAKALKLIGLRSTSEAVTSSEKETAVSPTGRGAGSIDDSPAGTAAGDDGSHTPSATSQTFELDTTDPPSKATELQLGPLLNTRMARQKAAKTKQQTSAYQRGLLKMTPAQAREHCDHSGWMKKKSPSLVTTWKPRLFILRGRRLSYYYDENDTEERGIIDISGHKVLAANNDPVLSLHATITGAKATSSSSTTIGADPSTSATESTGSTVAWQQQRPWPNADGHFYFKLLPPKVGQSRAVQFTKPTVHYFQCDSMAEGRKWMGEIMKATILHDLSSFETTNKQRTITLAKALERRERPPALKEEENKAAAEAEKAKGTRTVPATGADLGADPGADGDEEDNETDNGAGLNIHGLDYTEKGQKMQTEVGKAELCADDIPRSLQAARKRLDLFGNDYYLAHIFRTLRWWARPTHITVLGDLIGSQWVSDGEFESRASRFWNRVFRGTARVDDAVVDAALTGAATLPMDDPAWARRVINVAGNHDIGYAGDVSRARLDRFERFFGPANWDVRFDYPSAAAAAQTTYDYINSILAQRTRPVDDASAFTLLLTHLPLHKPAGVCVDAPFWDFWGDDDGGGAYRPHGLKEQNHLSQPVSESAILKALFGMSGHLHAPASAHTGIREITLRSMMGDFGGNAALLSAWFDFEANHWRYSIQMCPVGVQHLWWAVHVLDLVALALLALRLLLAFYPPSSSKRIVGVEIGKGKIKVV
ncbi:hypothetical protein DV735_g3040, partial [Chaetothyriales sp. CBS 134920]